VVVILRIKVVPNMLVQSLAFEASILGTTFVLRITHKNSLETGTKRMLFISVSYKLKCELYVVYL